jgi:DNA repair protein RadA/Sms
VEIQALVSPTSFGTPRRMSLGIDPNRTSLLLAVLEKRVGLELLSDDVFVSVAGGLHLLETASDLAVLTAVASAAGDAVLPEDLVVMGEVGLGGELRRVRGAARRLAEAARMGFRRAVIPAQNAADGRGIPIQLEPVPDLRSALRAALGDAAAGRLGVVRAVDSQASSRAQRPVKTP